MVSTIRGVLMKFLAMVMRSVFDAGLGFEVVDLEDERCSSSNHQMIEGA